MQSLDVDVDQHEDYYCCEDEARSEQDNEYEEEEDEEEEEEEEFQLVKPRRGGKFRVKKPETVNLPGWTDSDEGGWITPDNVAYVVNNSMLGRKKKSKKKTLLVACMTSDFAMQVCLFLKVSSSFLLIPSF